MRNRFLLIVLLLAGSLCIRAQGKKYVYEDTMPTVVEAPVPADGYDTDSTETRVEAIPNKTYEDVPEAEKIDTALYRNYLYVSADTVHRLKQMKDLAYARYLDSLLLAEQQEKKSKEPKKEMVAPSLSLSFLTPVLWILAIAFVAFILYTLFLKDGAFRKGTKKAQGAEVVEEAEEVRPGSNMDRLIAQALQQKNYRLAIRYQYLNCLHKLAEKGLVQFAADKTNYQYVSELSGKPALRNEFAGLTLHYEYVWYGEFDIDDVIYKKIEPGFTAFYNKL
jgi:hypothetical protein